MPSSASSSSPPPTACVQFRTEQLTLSDGAPLGSGALSHVVQCRLNTAAASALPVVVKIVSKLQVLQQGKVQSIMNEKAALQRLGPHPYVARLFGTSQSEDELYYVLEWLPHGDLLQHVRRTHMERLRDYTEKVHAASSKSGAAPLSAIPSSSTALRCLDFHDVQLITAQLVVALSRASAVGVVLRDLKPENVAFDEKYRACLLDFDTVDLDGAAVRPETNRGVACPPPCTAAVAENRSSSSDREEDDGTAPLRLPPRHPRAQSSPSAEAAAPTSAAAAAIPHRRLTVSEIQGMRAKSASFCGTAQYVSPEMVGECKWSFSSDLWALGALVYEMAYGVHLFAGMAQFDVLAKVIQGDYLRRADLFPPIDFGNPTGETHGDCFSAFKDFVLSLLNIDPSKRLGVHAVTQRFDEDALRRHPFFRGFAWEQVDAQLRTFRARSFQTSSTAAPSTQFGPSRSAFDKAGEAPRESESEADLPDETTLAAAAAAAQAALEELEAASVDPSPSLASLYHAKPFNDPSYAEYVYRATADANPFEKFFVDAVAGTRGGAPAAAASAATTEPVKEETTCKLAPAPAKALRPTSTASASTAAAAVAEKVEAAVLGDAVPADAYGAAPVNGREKDDEDDDVIDDVGMRYGGTDAHPDFHE